MKMTKLERVRLVVKISSHTESQLFHIKKCDLLCRTLSSIVEDLILKGIEYDKQLKEGLK